MHFHLLVEEIRSLTLPEKEEMRSLLDRFLADERRHDMAANYVASSEELQQDKLTFSSDVAQLRELLDD